MFMFVLSSDANMYYNSVQQQRVNTSQVTSAAAAVYMYVCGIQCYVSQCYYNTVCSLHNKHVIT